MKVENVKVIPGCISCRNCENVAPHTFQVAPKSKVISHEYNGKEAEIITAEILCPVNVIKVKKTGNASIGLKNGEIQQKKYLTDNVIELVIKAENFQAKPGQYVALQMQDWKGKFYRNYSITSFTHDSITLTIKLLSDGRGGKFLKKIEVGKKINYIGALGNFVLHDNNNPIVIFVTGTGISPAISMLEKIDKNRSIKLYFGLRDTSEIFYEKKLKEFQKSKNLEYKIFLSQEETDDYHYGRINQEIESVEQQADVYMCGNPYMINQVHHELKSQGHKEDKIFSEGFVGGKEERNIMKLIFLRGIIPYIKYIENILIYGGIIGIPLLYCYGVYTGTLYKVGFPIGGSISAFLFSLTWYAVVFVMYIRPLSQLFPKIGILKTLATQRKSLGIISAMVIVTIFFEKYIWNYDNLLSYFQADKWNSFYPFLGRLTEITAIILLLTSNNFSQKKLGIWWKRIQRSSYIYFLAGGIVAAQWVEQYYWEMGIWGVLIIAAFIKNRFFSKVT